MARSSRRRLPELHDLSRSSALRIAAILLVAGTAHAQPMQVVQPVQQFDADLVHLRMASVAAPGPAVDQLAMVRNAAPGSRLILKLDGPMTTELRRGLAGLGVEASDYLPKNAWIIRAKAEVADQLLALPGVAWVQPYATEYKIDPEVGGRVYATAERQDLENAGQSLLTVTLFEGVDADEAAGAAQVVEDFGGRVVRSEQIGGNTMLTVVGPKGIETAIALADGVLYIEEAPEVTLRSDTVRWIVQSNVAGQTPLYDNGLRGEGQIIGVLDGRMDVNHCSFVDDNNPIGENHRKVVGYNTSQGADSHGTHVAGIAAGDAGADNDLRGVAYEARIAFNTTPSFNETAFIAAVQTHHDQGARIHTNSWGNDSTTAYDSLARGIDVFSYNNEEDLVLFAVTNGSVLRNPENAKNVLAVGASQDTPNQANHCTAGIGPTTDGRRKPEIYAPGCGTVAARNNTDCGTRSLTGTSMACPAVAGTAALVRQYYTEGYYPSGAPNTRDAFTPTGALLKATLINSAVDMTGINGYPSQLEGWGRVLADNSLYFPGDDRRLIVREVRNANGLSTGRVQSEFFNFNAQAGNRVNITLVWTDPPATSGASFAAVNDVNLEVIAPDGTVYRGNSFANGISVPGGAFDDRNNVEQVHIPGGVVGSWEVRVIGEAINFRTQGYALVISGDVSEGPQGLSLNASNQPELVPAGVPVVFDVALSVGDDALVPGSLAAMYRTDGGAFAPAKIFPNGQIATVVIPALSCGDNPEVFVSAEGVDSGVVTWPPSGMSSPYSFEVGEIVVAADDAMETDTGWTVGAPDDDATSGVWNRMVPQATTAQPGSDNSPDGSICWVTDGFAGGSAGANDIDNGKTTLTSPVYDLTGLDDATISYARWYSNSTGDSANADVFVIDITFDGGDTWTNLETVGPGGPGTGGGWVTTQFRVGDFGVGTDEVQLRFVASDEGPGSIVEAAIDDLRIDIQTCTDGELCPGDLDGSGAVDLADLNQILANFGTATSSGDADGNGFVDLADLNIVLSAFGMPCN